MLSAIFCAWSRASARAASTLSFDQPREITRMLPLGPVASPAARVQYRASFILTSIYNVAHALLRAASALLPTPAQVQPAADCQYPSSGASLARTSPTSSIGQLPISFRAASFPVNAL